MTILNRDCWTIILGLVGRSSLWRLRLVNRLFYSLAVREINQRGYLIKPKYQFENKLNLLAQRYFHLDLSSTTGGTDYTNQDKSFNDYSWPQYDQLTNLQSVCLYNNKTRQNGYCYLTSVTKLDLTDAVISPTSLLAFTRLRELNCTDLRSDIWEADSFPGPVIGQLTQLEVLTTRSPAYDLIDIAPLTRLHQLDLSSADCLVAGVWAKFHQLEQLHLRDIDVTPDILLELASLPRLTNLQYVKFAGILPWSALTTFSRLTQLHLESIYDFRNGPGVGHWWPSLGRFTAQGINLSGVDLSSVVQLNISEIACDGIMWNSLSQVRELDLGDNYYFDLDVDIGLLSLTQLHSLGVYDSNSVSSSTWQNLTRLSQLSHLTWSQVDNLPPSMAADWLSQNKVDQIFSCAGIADYERE